MIDSRLKKGLGRGLSSFLGDASKKIETNKVAIKDITRNKFQPRKNFNKEHFVGKLKKRSKMFSGCVNTLQWYDVIKKVYKVRNQKHKVEFTPIKED